MEVTEIKYFVEAALLAAGRPMTLDQMQNLFDESGAPEKAQLREAIEELQKDYEPRGIEVAEVASGFRMQVRSTMAERLNRLWEERPPRYSRALFETLALIAYRQPMTRGEIEEVRGVAVSSNIMRSLLEREWVRIVGHRDVPGRPAMFGTTRQFLDYFGLKKLDDLPPLADLADWESLRVQLNLPDVAEDEFKGEVATDGESEEGSTGAVVTRLPVGEHASDEADADSDGEEPVSEADEADAAVGAADLTAASADDAGETADAGDEQDAGNEQDEAPVAAAESDDEPEPPAGDETAAVATEASADAGDEEAAADAIEDEEPSSVRNA